jgi:hypothetical protein
VGDSLITIRGKFRRRSSNRDSLYSFSDKKLGDAILNLISVKDIKQDDKTGYIYISDEAYDSKPGKFISFVQTFFYLKHSIRHLLFGSGIGNFSSKLAFRASGVNALGSYPQKYVYASPEFEHNHLYTFLFYHSEDASKHSVLNYPFSVYNQIFGEYGLLGALLFAVFYLGYFVSRYRRFSYGKYLLIIMLAFFITEYWFEFFSLIVIFELFMLLNLKENDPGFASLPEINPEKVGSDN